MLVFLLTLLHIVQCISAGGVSNEDAMKSKPKPAIDSHKGVLTLDSFTFPKIIPSDSQTTVMLVYQKAQVGDYGTDSIRKDYFSFADKVNVDSTSDDVLFAQVVVNGAFNSGLAKSFGLSDKFTDPALFIIPRGTSEVIPYPKTQPYHFDALSRFVSKHSNYYLDLIGTVKELNPLVHDFFSSTDRSNVVQATEQLAATFNAVDREAAEYYVKVMNKVLANGDYVDAEVINLKEALRDSKLAKKSKLAVAARLNVLQLFQSVQLELTEKNIEL